MNTSDDVSNFPTFVNGDTFAKEVYWFDVLAACLRDHLNEETWNALLDFRYCHVEVKKISLSEISPTLCDLHCCIVEEESLLVEEVAERLPLLDACELVAAWREALAKLIELSKTTDVITVTRPVPSSVSDKIAENSLRYLRIAIGQTNSACCDTNAQSKKTKPIFRDNPRDVAPFAPVTPE